MSCALRGLRSRHGGCYGQRSGWCMRPDGKRLWQRPKPKQKIGPTYAHGSTPDSAVCCRTSSSWSRTLAPGRPRACVGGTRTSTARNGRHGISGESAGPTAGSTDVSPTSSICVPPAHRGRDALASGTHRSRELRPSALEPKGRPDRRAGWRSRRHSLPVRAQPPDTPSGPVESPARLVRRCPSDGLLRSPSGQETTAGA